MSVYLDYNASAPIDLRVLETMVEVYKNNIGNADSRTHSFGENARAVVEHARRQVAHLFGVSTSEVYFTSGATESNNIAIQGLREYGEKSKKRHIITTAIEHKAVLETVKYMAYQGYEVEIIAPDLSGRVNENAILNKVRDDTLLVSVMHVNNETGIIQPVKELGEELYRRDVFFHVDATQSSGKLVEEIRGFKYNILSFSAHKLMGPQGVGGLILRTKSYKRPPIKAIIFGGEQEGGIRPGTIPVALTAGCGKACEIAENEYKENNIHVRAIREQIIAELNNSGIDYHINGDQEYCIGNTLNVCLAGVSSEALMILTKQYCGLSNGSACTSKIYSPSYVLAAMGVSMAQIDNSIRISWGPDTQADHVIENFRNFLKIAKGIRS